MGQVVIFQFESRIHEGVQNGEAKFCPAAPIQIGGDGPLDQIALYRRLGSGPILEFAQHVHGFPYHDSCGAQVLRNKGLDELGSPEKPGRVNPSATCFQSSAEWLRVSISASRRCSQEKRLSGHCLIQPAEAWSSASA